MVAPVASAWCLWLMASPDRGAWENLMHWRSWLAALFIVLALAGCAQETNGQAGTPYTPYSPQDHGIRPEHGGGDGGGGGGGGAGM
jgi:hypothetical protein